MDRLLGDDHVHEQLAAAGVGLRDSYRRARHLPTEKALQDQTIYDNVRAAASGLTQATRRVVGKPPPEPPRRRRRPLLLVMLAAGVTVVYAAKQQRRQQSARAGAGEE
jgi:hypothetical protein